MNSFWGLLDWFFPSIRLTDDLRLDDAEAALAGQSYALHARTLSSSNRLPHQSRLQASSDAERQRQRERRKIVERESRGEEESEIVSLRRENNELKARIKQLEEDLQLAKQSAQDLSPPAPPLNGALHQPPPRAPSSSDPVALRKAYDALSASHALVQQTLRERSEEVASLQTFLTKTDEISGAQLIQAIQDLNSEILQLAASVAEEFAGTYDRRETAIHSSDFRILHPAIGEGTTRLLREQNHQADPTFVQFAIQAWEVACVGKLMTPFCCGVSDPVQQVLSAVFQRIQEHGKFLLTIYSIYR